MNMVHDRVGVQGQLISIDKNSVLDISEEYYNDIQGMRIAADELNNARLELGRLMQVVNNLISVCNNREKLLADTKQNLIEKMELGPGNWAIDFEKKQIGLVSTSKEDEAPKVV